MAQSTNRKPGPSFTQSGFTLVELVSAMVIAGILAAVGIGLFTSSSGFSPLIATQQLQSSILLAQQAAFAGNDFRRLVISQTSNEFVFSVEDTDPGTSDRLVQQAVPRSGTSLTAPGGVPFTLTFSESGAVSAGLNQELVFTGESTYRICISSLGAVYAGNCQS